MLFRRRADGSYEEATSNHGNHTVSIFARSRGNGLQCYAEPVSVILDPKLRHPHSVAFRPRSRHVVEGDAGANINARNKMEGGPKGIAIYQDRLAICSPEFGINIYRFRERRRRSWLFQ